MGTEVGGWPEADAASLRGELCCVDTVPGLRPFTGHSSPGGRKPESRATGSVNPLFLLLNEIPNGLRVRPLLVIHIDGKENLFVCASRV